MNSHINSCANCGEIFTSTSSGTGFCLVCTKLMDTDGTGEYMSLSDFWHEVLEYEVFATEELAVERYEVRS